VRAGESRRAAGGAPAQALGLQRGQLVERGPYDLLFGERKAPDGTPLGRPPGSGQNAADIYARLLAAEPHATAERQHELRTEAVRQARQSPLYFDLTLSLSKSISIFHASLGENARLARQAGDQAGDAYWSGLVAEVDAMIWQATWVAFGYFQREAGYTRTGSHHARVNGRETGQWHQGWADKLARTLGVPLASVAPSVWHDGAGRANARTHSPESLDRLELARAAQKAVTLAQQEKSTWTRADLIKYLGRVMPRTGRDPAAAAALLEELADRALRSQFEPVICLEAPEAVAVPRSLLRADGRSIYQRHGGVR
jgi:hypothetical protein